MLVDQSLKLNTVCILFFLYEHFVEAYQKFILVCNTRFLLRWSVGRYTDAQVIERKKSHWKHRLYFNVHNQNQLHSFLFSISLLFLLRGFHTYRWLIIIRLVYSKRHLCRLIQLRLRIKECN